MERMRIVGGDCEETGLKNQRVEFGKRQRVELGVAEQENPGTNSEGCIVSCTSECDFYIQD